MKKQEIENLADIWWNLNHFIWDMGQLELVKRGDVQRCTAHQLCKSAICLKQDLANKKKKTKRNNNCRIRAANLGFQYVLGTVLRFWRTFWRNSTEYLAEDLAQKLIQKFA